MTNYEELQTFLSLLPHTPILIPIVANGKEPDIPEGEHWKDPKFYLTPEQAIQRLKEGLNVGIVAHDWLVVVDLDNPKKYVLAIETVTVLTRNGRLHKFFVNAGDVKNAVGKNTLAHCGEVRAEWQYVLVAGSYVSPDADALPEATGLYHVVKNGPIATLHREDLPKDFIPTEEGQAVNHEVLTKPVSIRNKHGWSLEDIRKRDQKLDDLLNGKNADLPSDSEGDMSTLAKLLFWEFEENEAVTILKQYRARAKLERGDYILGMLSKITVKEKISDLVNPKKWSPQGGTTDIEIGKYFGLDDNNHISFLPIVFAKDLLQNYTFKTTRDNETVYCFNVATGTYEANGETMIKEEMAKILDENTRQHFYVDILFYVKAKTYFDRPTEHPNKLVLNNGILNMETYELEPFSDKKFLQIHVPRTYDPKLGCPLIQQFILEVVGEAQVPLLQEWIGYCLYMKYPIHKAMILLGPGANGKSTLINLIDRFLGEKNKASITLQALCNNRFAASSLDGKLVNLCADIPNKALVQTGMFKMLVGADSIPAERKFKDAYTFDNIAKLMFSTNEIPKTSDDTIAYFRRWLIINCTNYFPPSKANTRILDDICTPSEFSGLLNWALIGLKRLLKNGQFSDNRTWEQERERYLASSNSALAFIEGHINPSQKERDRVTKEELYTTYVKYCRENDLLIMRQADLTLNMRQAVPDAKEVQFRVGKERKKGWAYITVTAVTSSLLNTAEPKKVQFAVLSETEVTEVTPSDPKKTCVLCLKPLWPSDTTYYQGKLAHCVCVAKLVGTNQLSGEQP